MIDDISCVCRSVQRPVQSIDSLLPAPVLNAPAPKPSSSATSGNCPPDTTLHQDSADSEAVSPATASDSTPTLLSPARHNVGPESTWAVRQSAELEDLQAALEKQCLRRGRQAAGMPAAPAAAAAAVTAAEVDSVPPQELQDPPGPKYADVAALQC